ncbi:MAG: methionyl-tRNA formyltransferase [Alphaproteobacteria bacterium]|nr:methionyl-tRNA formyltransferase [Alphaproteobacteria bacterium]
MTERLKIVFMGTPDFAVPALKNLIEKHDVVGVFTKEAKPVGRNMVLTKSPVQIVAEEHGIPVHTPKNFKDILSITKVQMFHPDMIVVCAYGVILPERVLDVPRLGCINIHASILPRHRGANPIQRAVMAGDRMAGITIMNMDQGVDTGAMLLKDAIPVPQDMTYGELEHELSEMGGRLIIEYLDNMDNILPQRQPREFTLAPKLEKEEAKINWENNATTIHNLVRGLSPYPYANFTHNDNVIKLIKSEVVKGTTDKPAGTVLNNNLEIACGEGTILKILSVQKSGGKIMDAKAFLNGYKINADEVLK